MDVTLVECTARLSHHIASKEYAACVRQLSPRPAGAAPFCLSYEINMTGTAFSCDPTCYVWFESEDRTVRRELGYYQPEMTRSFAPQMVSFLAFYAIRNTAQDMIAGMLGEGRGERFHLGATPHGVIILAEHPQIVGRGRSPNACIGAIVSDEMSNHTRMAGHGELSKCATHMLRRVRRASFLSEDVEVRISVPAP